MQFMLQGWMNRKKMHYQRFTRTPQLTPGFLAPAYTEHNIAEASYLPAWLMHVVPFGRAEQRNYYEVQSFEILTRWA